ncbi:MAG: phage tail protein [Gorillibacterium sp.]|nr:phage tail protein [Gorillibacterium sp.]
MGQDAGYQYRIKKNIISTNFKDNVAGLVTRLFSQMKDGRTFIGLDASHLTEEEHSLLSSVPGAIVGGKIAINYLISPYAQFWSNTTNTYYDGEIMNQNIEDPLELLEATRKALLEKEIPAFEVSASAADIHKIDATEAKPDLGDTVHCYDPDMQLENMTARITELTEYPYARDKHSQATLSNVMMQDYDDIIADLEKSKNIVDNLLSGGKIRADVFEAFAKQAVIDINNSKSEVIYDPRGIVLKSKINNLHQVVESAEGFYISTDGGATADAAFTALGIVAEKVIGKLGNFITIEIGSGNNVFKSDSNGIYLGNALFASAPFSVNMAGHMKGAGVDISGEITSSIITGGQVNGTNVNGSSINGGVITGALIRTSSFGQRFEVSVDGWRTYDASGNIRISTLTSSTYGTSAIEWRGPSGAISGWVTSADSSLSVAALGLLQLSAIGHQISMLADSIDFTYVNNVLGFQMRHVLGLISALDGKATFGIQTGTQTAINGGIAPGTQLALFGGGYVTWSGVPAHSHTQN